MSYAPDTLARPTDWSNNAACGNLPDLFELEDPRSLEAAKAVCTTRCPVRESCLTAALAEEGRSNENHRAGVRGGLTPAERSRLARRLRDFPEAVAETILAQSRPQKVLEERSVLVGGGHREWRRSSPVAVNGISYSPRQLAWYVAYGEKPEGRLRQRCEHKGCIAAEHLKDLGEPVLGCGTHNGYRAHRARGEEACRPCKDANAARDRRLRTTGTSISSAVQPDVSEAA